MLAPLLWNIKLPLRLLGAERLLAFLSYGRAMIRQSEQHQLGTQMNINGLNRFKTPEQVTHS